MRVYISGPITDSQTAFDDFDIAAASIEQSGHVAVNPFKLHHDHDKSWAEYMKVDLVAMLSCDAVLALKGWQLSRGANTEVRLALELGISVHEQVWRLV